MWGIWVSAVVLGGGMGLGGGGSRFSEAGMEMWGGLWILAGAFGRMLWDRWGGFGGCEDGGGLGVFWGALWGMGGGVSGSWGGV